MAKWIQWTDEQRKQWDEFVETRPPEVRALCEKYPIDVLFLLKTSGHRCFVRSYNEDGTVSVQIDGRFNRVLFGRNVFGVNPADLEECDLPARGEDVGDTSVEAGYTEDDVRNILIPKLKADGVFSEKCGGENKCDAGG